MAWPQPALENISIQAAWDGNPANPVHLRVTIEFTSIPSSKLCLVRHEHPKVKSVKVGCVKRLTALERPRAAKNRSIDSLNIQDIDEDLPGLTPVPQRRMLFTPPDQSTATSVDIPPSTSASDSESLTDLKLGQDQPSAPLPSQDINAPRLSQSTVADSRIPVPPHRKQSRLPKRNAHPSLPKPSWRVPAAGETIFPRGRKSLLDKTTPRRVSRSADVSMLQKVHRKKLKRRSCLRSSSAGAPSRQDVTVQINPRESVANWLQNTRTGWWSSEEATDHPIPPKDKRQSDKRDFILHPVIRPEQSRPNGNDECRSRSPGPKPKSSNEPPHEDGSYGAESTHLRGGVLPTTSPLLGNSFLGPMIQDQHNLKWVVCPPMTEEEAWLVDFEAQVYLERHPQGGYMLDIPGLPQQAGDAQGEYVVNLEDPQFSINSPDDMSVLDKVQIVDNPGTLRFLRNGESHGHFPIDEGFSLRFLTLERNRWLTPEQFDVKFTVEQTYEVGKDGDLTISHGLVCTIHPGRFIWWAIEVTFMLFVHGTPQSRTSSLQIVGDFTIDMGVGSGYDFENESRITISKRVVELSKPIKIIWKQHCGSLSTMIAPSVSNRSCNAEHSERRSQLHGPETVEGRQLKQYQMPATPDSDDSDYQENAEDDGSVQRLEPKSAPVSQSLTNQNPRKDDHATPNQKTIFNKINHRSRIRLWLSAALKACLVFFLGFALFRSGTLQAWDLKAAVSTCRARIANGNALQWDVLEAYLKNEWGVELVDIKGDPTGWKTLRGVVRDEEARESDDEAADVDDQGRLGKVRDAVDYALGWRPVA